ncbi:hypothetical protein [Streptomyces sp. NRRL S-495]|uniref:hypothetical protein n=1 Tax=Streptomyces sp. NRRL S-495 TaxID=1609133 RepID=UPI0005F8ACAB|nr:hypothetical protein [Streptomyces sp. NRRL S-495]KJY35926.1 hypothetical protein VR45_12930 [Streptomyces sp. NRRL S-495]
MSGVGGGPGAGGGAAGGGTDPGVLGTALGVVLAFSLAEGSWQWFSTYLGLTLLAVVLAFGRVPSRASGRASAYGWSLAAYSLVVGLCVALALAPALQRWDWLFPMPGTRDSCVQAGRYESLHTRAALADLADADPQALAYEQEQQSRVAVDDCLSATTTRWLPVYALGTALVVAGVVWVSGRRRAGADA